MAKSQPSPSKIYGTVRTTPKRRRSRVSISSPNPAIIFEIDGKLFEARNISKSQAETRAKDGLSVVRIVGKAIAPDRGRVTNGMKNRLLAFVDDSGYLVGGNVLKKLPRQLGFCAMPAKRCWEYKCMMDDIVVDTIKYGYDQSKFGQNLGAIMVEIESDGGLGIKELRYLQREAMDLASVEAFVYQRGRKAALKA